MTPPHARPDPVRRISGPAELVQAVPYLLGFHPAASVVLVGLADGELVVTARLDLADDVDYSFDSTVEHTIHAMQRGGSRQIIGLLYPQDDTDEHRVAEVVRAGATGLRCEVLDVLCVVDGRWRSLGCTAFGCCPPEGRSLPDGPSAFAAAATVSGVVALPDRAAVGRQLDPAPGRESLAGLVANAENAQHDAVLAGRGQRRTRSVKRAILASARAADDASERGATAVDDATVARFGVALGDIAVRDAVWTAIDDRRVDGRALWRDLARRLPPPYDAPALFLFGWATWRSGDGALAGMAAERAVASDPTYSAADMLLAALTHGVDPRALPRVRLPRPA